MKLTFKCIKIERDYNRIYGQYIRSERSIGDLVRAKLAHKLARGSGRCAV